MKSKEDFVKSELSKFLLQHSPEASFRYQTIAVLCNTDIIRVYIIAKRANQYIVAFCIAISYDIYLSGGGGQATLDGVVCGSVHLQTQICGIFGIHRLMWILFLRFSSQEFYS